jgi:RNA polymerase sigma-70 factor (sigma-E family)
VRGREHERERERADYVEFVEARYQSLCRTAYLLTGNRSGAEDLVQTVLTNLYLSWSKARRAASVEAYVRRALVNESISLSRRRWTTEVVSDEVVELRAPVGGGVAEGVVESQAMWQALGQLSGRQRAVMVLRYYEDLTEAEIGFVLGISPGTVKAHAHAALVALADRVPRTTAVLGEEERA